MFLRHKRTKAVREINGNSPEGRELVASGDWDKIEGPSVEEPELPAGVIQPPEPSISDED